MTIASPGSVKTRSSSATPDITSATSETRAGSTVQPSRPAAKAANASGSRPRFA